MLESKPVNGSESREGGTDLQTDHEQSATWLAQGAKERYRAAPLAATTSSMAANSSSGRMGFET